MILLIILLVFGSVEARRGASFKRTRASRLSLMVEKLIAPIFFDIDIADQQKTQEHIEHLSFFYEMLTY
jgi:hypothetical protein